MNESNFTPVHVQGKSYMVDIANIRVDEWIIPVSEMPQQFETLASQGPFVKIIS